MMHHILIKYERKHNIQFDNRKENENFPEERIRESYFMVFDNIAVKFEVEKAFQLHFRKI